MGHDARLRRVAVAATPALLSDCLRVLLRDHVEVTIVLHDAVGDESTGEGCSLGSPRCDAAVGDGVPQPRFDVAIVTSEVPVVHADVTIVLHEGRDARGGGTVHQPDGKPPTHLDDLGAVLRFVEDRARADGADG